MNAVRQSLLFGALLLTGACASDDPEPSEPSETPDARKDAGGSRDAGRDAGSQKDLDAGERPRDAGPAKTTDTGAAKPDTGSAKNDAGKDAGGQTACVEFTLPSGVDCSPASDGVLPKDLRCTGLYGDFDERKIACGLVEYKPAHELWSDGAAKRRWVSVPEGKTVDTSDPNEFVYPDGTRFFKEFRIEGANGEMRMAETRLLERRAGAWLYTSYVWSEDEKQALQMDNAAGVKDLYGSGHTVPNRDQCKDCHVGRKEYVLGWDALLLGPGATGVTRDNIVELGLASSADGLALAIPGNDIEKEALGYLHANCGISCHNENPDAPGRESNLFLRLEAGELANVQATDAFRSGMNKVPAENAKLEGLNKDVPLEEWLDIKPTDPTRSLLVERQKLRGVEGQMPRIATNEVDEQGVELVTKWIESMTRDAGYPAPK
jgi:hypothetical protein